MNTVLKMFPTPEVSLACSQCKLCRVCLPGGLRDDEKALLDSQLVSGRQKVARGEKLFQDGDHFHALYAVWTGHFKTRVSSRDGREQVTGFQMGGDLLGLDGIASQRHQADAVALEDAQVCVIPYAGLQALMRRLPSLQQQFHRKMSREIVHRQGTMLLLGRMDAEERLAAYLIDLAGQLQLRGLSPSALVLRMSREDIGSYLGLTLETVSRTFSKFQALGLLFVRHRQIQITDPLGMRQLVEGETP